MPRTGTPSCATSPCWNRWESESPAVRFQVPERPADREAAAAVLRQLGLGDGFAIINVGAGWPSKLWPAERFAAVAAHLGQRWTLPSLVVWGNDQERRGPSRSSPAPRATPAWPPR